MPQAVKKPKRLQPYQAYLALHRTEVLPIISKRYEEYRKGLPTDVTPRPWLSFLIEHARKMLSEADDSVKAAVEEFREKEARSSPGLEEMLEGGNADSGLLQERTLAMQE